MKLTQMRFTFSIVFNFLVSIAFRCQWPVHLWKNSTIPMDHVFGYVPQPIFWISLQTNEWMNDLLMMCWSVFCLC